MKKCTLFKRNRPNTLKRTPLKRAPRTGGSSYLERQKQQQIDWEFYQEIWNERPHKCEVTDKYLGEECLTTMMHHILPKEKYPQYRHCKWNIALLDPTVHNQYEIFPDKVPELVERQKELLNIVNGIIE